MLSRNQIKLETIFLNFNVEGIVDKVKYPIREIRIKYFHLPRKGIPSLTFIRSSPVYCITYSRVSVYLHEKFCKTYISLYLIETHRNSKTEKNFVYLNLK